MPNPFSKGAAILVKIRTKTEFFQSHATVAHSAEGLGMGVMFQEISPPFFDVLERWLLDVGKKQSPRETNSTVSINRHSPEQNRTRGYFDKAVQSKSLQANAPGEYSEDDGQHPRLYSKPSSTAHEGCAIQYHAVAVHKIEFTVLSNASVYSNHPPPKSQKAAKLLCSPPGSHGGLLQLLRTLVQGRVKWFNKFEGLHRARRRSRCICPLQRDCGRRIQNSPKGRPQAANVTRRALNFTPHNQVVTSEKKPHLPPRLSAYDPKNVPEWVNLMRQDVLKGAHVLPTYTTVVDQDRKFVEVSQSLSKLVGYKIEELIGTRYDDLTALNTADIPMTYNLLSRLGYLHGLWMLVHRTGYRMLIRYESWLRPDANIESNIELLQTIIGH